VLVTAKRLGRDWWLTMFDYMSDPQRPLKGHISFMSHRNTKWICQRFRVA